MITRFIIITAIAFVALLKPTEAQQRKPTRIGYVTADAGSAPPEAFVQGLRGLGYIEGKNITFEYRTSEGKPLRNPDLAAELVRLKVDLIVAEGTSPSLAAKKATTTIPIVMVSTTNPVGTGIVDSFAHPGGNVTGVATVTGELGGKLLDLLKEVIPGVTRVVIPGPPPGRPSSDFFMKETELPARALKIQVIRTTVNGREDFENVFRVAAKERAQALLVRIPPFIPAEQRKQFVELAAKKRLPAIYQLSSWVDIGGLLSYGADRNFEFQRAAVYVDKILKSATPAALPVEQPMKFEFVVNLKAAKQIGLTIPPNVLVRADRVIR
jgi:putative ABC transport system substrate-binding protein